MSKNTRINLNPTSKDMRELVGGCPRYDENNYTPKQSATHSSLDWKELIGRDFPPTEPITQATIETTVKAARRYRT